MFDVLTIAAVADELSTTLLGGRVQRVGLVDPRTAAFEVYAGGRRHGLVVSADDTRAGIRLADALPSLDPNLVTPFVLLLRKYVRGGVLVGIEQPPLERIVLLSIAKRFVPDHERRARGLPAPSSVEEPTAEELAAEADETAEDEGEGDATFVHLAVEMMGRHSNLILVDDDHRVMESVKRVTAAMSRVRPVLPRLPYVPPPPLDRLDPRRFAAAEAAGLLAAADPAQPLWRALVGGLRGTSPQMAREIAHRAAGDAEARVGDLQPGRAADLARETRHLVEPLLTSAWSPRVYRLPIEPAAAEDDVPGEVVAFAAVPMAHLAVTLREEPVATISRAAELAAAESDATGPVRHAQRRERLLAAVGRERERQERRRSAMAQQQARAADGDRLRRWGETIYAWLWQIEPGQTTLEVEGESIPLDPTIGPKETAQGYFEQYRKAQGAAAQLPGLESEVDHALAYLDQLAVQIRQAAGFAELEALAAEWEAHAGPPPGAKPRRKPGPPRRPRPFLTDDEGNEVFVGQTGHQNEIVTFEIAGPDDTWLHARGVAGSHVVIRWRVPGAEEQPGTVEIAARLAAWYSAARAAGTVEVDVAKRKHVRKIKGGGPGLVTYRNERTVAVRPADEAAARPARAPD